MLAKLAQPPLPGGRRPEGAQALLRPLRALHRHRHPLHRGDHDAEDDHRQAGDHGRPWLGGLRSPRPAAPVLPPRGAAAARRPRRAPERWRIGSTRCSGATTTASPRGWSSSPATTSWCAAARAATARPADRCRSANSPTAGRRWKATFRISLGCSTSLSASGSSSRPAASTPRPGGAASTTGCRAPSLPLRRGHHVAARDGAARRHGAEAFRQQRPAAAPAAPPSAPPSGPNIVVPTVPPRVAAPPVASVGPSTEGFAASTVRLPARSRRSAASRPIRCCSASSNRLGQRPAAALQGLGEAVADLSVGSAGR